jgi:hypothetical protein
MSDISTSTIRAGSPPCGQGSPPCSQGSPLAAKAPDEIMSDFSAIRAGSPPCGQSQEDGNFPSQPKTPALEPCERQLSRQHWQESTILGFPTRTLPDKVIVLHSHPSFIAPLATLADSELGRSLAAWHGRTFPNALTPCLGNAFVAERLLTLLTNFTRHVGSSPNTDHAQAVLQVACMETLERFTSPTTFEFRYVGPRVYFGLRLALHHHRNHLVQDGRGINVGRVLGRLSSWISDEDHLTLCIQPLCGDAFLAKLSWQEASKAFTFPPLLRRKKFQMPTTGFVRPLI